ncbi:MAG TPA: metallophosphoesterase [Candidatus Paceibacterota bacterium]|nr:metallophosphoesterase [Candidatus Paceibacterota bacterium]
MPLAFVIILIVMQALLVLVHVATFEAAAAAFGFASGTAKAVLVAWSFSFVASSVLARFSRNPLAQWFYKAASYWFGLIFFLFIGGAAFAALDWIAVLAQVPISTAVLGVITFGAAFAIHLYGTLISGQARITQIEVPLPNVPDYWKDRVLVFVSDIHLGAVRGRGFMSKVARRIAAQHPAAVLIGGDLFDGVKCDAEAQLAPLRDLAPDLGTFFITGNHEYYGDFDAFMKAIRGARVRVLDNEIVDLQGLQLAGFDDRAASRREDFAKILDGMRLDPARPALYMKHEPIHLDLAEAKGFAAGFFGHTHDGQIFPLTIIARRIYRGFSYGLRRLGNAWMYVSSGVGTWGPPLRLGTKSEIVVVRFA